MVAVNRKEWGQRIVYPLLPLLLASFLAGCASEKGDAPGPGKSITGTGLSDNGPGQVSDRGSPMAARSGSDSQPNAAQPAKRPSPGSRGGEGSESVRTLTDSGAPVSSKTAAIPSSDVFVEKLTGYRTPTEYLIISSRKFARAVVAVTLPLDYENSPEERYPLVIAFGGMGECMKPPRLGALAWVEYYKADEAIRALDTNHLDRTDFKGLVTTDQLTQFNNRLDRHPYRGVILACPYSPPLTLKSGPEFPEYEAFIMRELIPELKRRYRIAAGGIGVDGVSMGGARSLYYGFKYPEVFSSIGAVQGAFGPYMEIYKELVVKNGAILKDRAVQLVTSDGDTMAQSVEKMHGLLEGHSIPHTFLKLIGPHDYIFNQGPGSLSLLVFHNQALRSRSAGSVK